MIHYIDIGARDLSFALWSEPEENFSCIAFEPDLKEFEKLSKSKDSFGFKELLILPYGISNKQGFKKLYITKQPGCSSFKKPIEKFDEKFGRDGNFIIDHEIEVNVNTLDYAIEDNNIAQDASFIMKIDVEGGELDCLKGFEKNIDKLLFAQVEVNFLNYREGQNSAGSILDFFRVHNFNLISIKDLGEYRFSGEAKYDPNQENFLKKQANGYPVYSIGTTCSCDFIFLKDPDYVQQNQMSDYIKVLIGSESYDTFKYLLDKNKLDNIDDIQKIKNNIYKKSKVSHLKKKIFHLSLFGIIVYFRELISRIK